MWKVRPYQRCVRISDASRLSEDVPDYSCLSAIINRVNAEVALPYTWCLLREGSSQDSVCDQCAPGSLYRGCALALQCAGPCAAVRQALRCTAPGFILARDACEKLAPSSVVTYRTLLVLACLHGIAYKRLIWSVQMAVSAQLI